MHCVTLKDGNVTQMLTKGVEGEWQDNKFTVPLKRKLPVASHFLCDENCVARESLMQQFLA